MPNSMDRAADERELMDAIWLLVLTESYRFNRMDEYAGLPRVAVVERYLAQNPEMKRFLERHIEANTCAQGARELRERMAQWSAAYRKSLPPQPPRAARQRSFLADLPGWGRREAEPAPTAPPEAQSEGPAGAAEASRRRRALPQQAFDDFWGSFPADRKPGLRQVLAWARQNGFSAPAARALWDRQPDKRPVGRPGKCAGNVLVFSINTIKHFVAHFRGN